MHGFRIYNAACPRSKELPDLHKLLETSIPVVLIGSVSLRPRVGNEKKSWLKDSSGATLNSFGLPNRGVAYYQKVLPAFIKAAHDKKKKVRVNIVAETPREFEELAHRCRDAGVDELEVNVGCPNVWKNGKQKRIPAFDLVLLETIVRKVLKVSKPMRVDVKLSPYSDPELLERVARLLARLPIQGVVLSNTFANAYSPKTDLAGLGGSGLHAITLGQVRQFRKLLPKRIRIIGVGGVRDKQTIKNFVAAGADEVQVGSHYFEHGADVFKYLLQAKSIQR